MGSTSGDLERLQVAEQVRLLLWRHYRMRDVCRGEMRCRCPTQVPRRCRHRYRRTRAYCAPSSCSQKLLAALQAATRVVELLGQQGAPRTELEALCSSFMADVQDSQAREPLPEGALLSRLCLLQRPSLAGSMLLGPL